MRRKGQYSIHVRSTCIHLDRRCTTSSGRRVRSTQRDRRPSRIGVTVDAPWSSHRAPPRNGRRRRYPQGRTPDPTAQCDSETAMRRDEWPNGPFGGAPGSRRGRSRRGVSGVVKNARPRLSFVICSTNPCSERLASSMKVLMVMPGPRAAHHLGQGHAHGLRRRRIAERDLVAPCVVGDEMGGRLAVGDHDDLLGPGAVREHAPGAAAARAACSCRRRSPTTPREAPRGLISRATSENPTRPRKSRGNWVEINVCSAMATFLAARKLSRIGIDSDRSTMSTVESARQVLGARDLEVVGLELHRCARSRRAAPRCARCAGCRG